MSSITKLQIRGIRSFGPDSDEVIQFYTPLTMIVGANGCGKTTIIESLKYCCTGSVPPNCKNGHSLVNDPGMTDAAEVKAHIKLLFKNRGGRDCLAVRSLQVTKKKAKTEFKALEGTIRTTNEQGQPVSSSYKCMDMDRLLPENLGVSPAILENVIFVHQEDSNWPMQESAVLKKKFDDIFESTRYTKALDELKKTKKEFTEQAKNLKVDLAAMSVHVQNAAALRRDYDEYQNKLVAMQEDLQQINDRLERSDVKLQEAMAIINTASAGAQELRDVETRVGETERRIADKCSSLERELDTHSDEDLRVMLANFDNEMLARQRELRALKTQVDGLQGEMQKVRGQMDELNKKKGQAAALQEQMASLKGEQVRLASELGKRHAAMPVFPQAQWNQRVARDIVNFLNSEMQRTTNESQSSLSSLKSTVTQAERSFQETQSKLQKTEVELSMKTDEGKALQRESEQKKAEMQRLTNAKQIIQSRQSEFDQVRGSHDEFMALFRARSEELKRELKSVTDEMRNLQEQISSDSKTLSELSSLRGELAAIDASVKSVDNDISAIPAQLESLFASHRDYFPNLLPALAPSALSELEQLADRVSEHTQSLQRRSTAKHEEVSRNKSSLAAHEALLSSQRERSRAIEPKLRQIAEKEQDLRVAITALNELRNGPILSESALDAVPFDASLENVLVAAKTTEDEARELLIIAKAGKAFLKRLKKMRQKNPGQCPCCGQGFARPEVANTFEQRTQALFSINDDPNAGEANTVEEHKAILEKCTDVYSRIQVIQSALLPLLPYRADLTTIDASLRQLEDEKHALAQSLQRLETDLSQAEDEAERAVSLQRQLNEIAQSWSAAQQKKQDLLHKRKRLMTQSSFSLSSSASSSSSVSSTPAAGFDLSTLSFDELEQRHREHIARKDALAARKEQLSLEEANLSKRSFAAQKELSDCESALRAAQLEGSKAVETESALRNIQQKIADNDARKVALQRERETLQRDVTTTRTELQRVKTELDTRERSAQEKQQAMRNDVEVFSRLCAQSEETERKYQEMNLGSVDDALQRLRGAVANKQREQEELSAQITEKSNELSNEEHVKRNVQGNLDLRTLRRELTALRDRLRECQARSGVNAAQLEQAERERRVAEREKQTLQSERDVLTGKVVVLQQNVQEAQRKLAHADYRDVEERHRKVSIEFETTNLAVSDLTNYHAALEKALLNFHTLKIREINKIVRELWQMIYQGQDIDAIELESGTGELEDGTAAAAGPASKSYNYRVVMKKGGLPLDMRGRCSAGQKVLASIVIRLALAETFCLNCGILALDEPTTNLDEPNKGALAQALGRLIVGRSKQQNFQLVCITHDEEFVQMMRTELSANSDFNLPEYYFRVFRSEDPGTARFFSHIERIPWEDM